MDEAVVVDLDEADGLGVEVEGFALVVEGGDALEEGFVEVDGVGVGGEARGDLGLDVLEGGVGVGSGDGSEDGEDAGEETAGLLHRYEGVLEGGGSGVVGDEVDLGALLGHAGFDGGEIVGVFDAVEGRGLIGESAGGGEGIGSDRGLRRG